MKFICYSLLLLLVSCSGVNSSDKDSSRVEDNEPGVIIFSIPEVLQTDSTYSIELEVIDSDTLNEVTIKEQFNDSPADSFIYEGPVIHLDTTLTRSFDQTGNYTITITASDRHPDQEVLSKKIETEIVEVLVEREITIHLSNTIRDEDPEGVIVQVYDTRDTLLSEGEIENGVFEFETQSAEGRTETVRVEFYGHGYIDFSDDLDHDSSGDFEFSIDPAPIKIESLFPELTPGETITIDVRDYSESADPDDEEPVSFDKAEFSDPDNQLFIEEQDDFIFEVWADEDVSEKSLNAKLTIYTETNTETKTIEFPIEGAEPITQIADTIEGRYGEDTEFELSDYFDSSSSITDAQFTSPDITVDHVTNDTYRLSQDEELTGSHTIEVWLENEDGQTLEAELTYIIKGGGELVIMPLGDSLTNDGRSREPIWNLLVDDGYEVDFVGDQHQQGRIPDPDHEGVGGITIQEVIDKAEDLMQRHDPEFVNLMIGTNDIAWYTDEEVSDISARWNDLVQILLDSSSDETYIIAATIPPVTSKEVGRDDRDRAVLVRQYNEDLRDYIEDRRKEGDLIVLADVEAELDVEDHVSSDGVHLNDEGYKIMGTVYYEAIISILLED